MTLHRRDCKSFKSFRQRLKLFSVTFLQNLNSDFKGYLQTFSLDFYTPLGSETPALAQVFNLNSEFWNHQAKALDHCR